MHFLRYRQSLHAALSSDLIISLALENLACHYNVTISTDIEDLIGHLQIVEHYRSHFEPCKECMVESDYSIMTVFIEFYWIMGLVHVLSVRSQEKWRTRGHTGGGLNRWYRKQVEG